MRSGLAWIRCVAWSPDGKRFAYRTDSQVIMICDAETGKRVLPLLEGDEEPRSLAWSPNGKILAVGYRNHRFGEAIGRVKLWDTETGEEIVTSAYGRGTCDSVVWRPNGSHLAASGHPARVWDSALGSEFVLAGTDGSCLDWSTDGKRLAVGNAGGRITIHDSAIWARINVLEGHLGFVEALAWHPHLPRLASGARDRTIRIWDTLTGRELYSIEKHSKRIEGLDWSPDGLRLASASRDSTVRIWDASAADRFLKRQQREVNTQSQAAKWGYANGLARQGQLDEAIASFKALSAEDPDLPDYRLRLPSVLFDAGKQDEAIRMLQQSVAEFPERREYRDEL